MLAVIKKGGKQYLVRPGEKIKMEKVNKKIGEEIVFSEVLLLAKDKKVEIGKPLVEGARVIGKVISRGKGEKKIVFKYKRKTRYKVKKGHRQPFTLVEITEIKNSEF